MQHIAESKCLPRSLASLGLIEESAKETVWGVCVRVRAEKCEHIVRVGSGCSCDLPRTTATVTVLATHIRA